MQPGSLKSRSGVAGAQTSVSKQLTLGFVDANGIICSHAKGHNERTAFKKDSDLLEVGRKVNQVGRHTWRGPDGLEDCQAVRGDVSHAADVPPKSRVAEADDRTADVNPVHHEASLVIAAGTGQSCCLSRAFVKIARDPSSDTCVVRKDLLQGLWQKLGQP